MPAHVMQIKDAYLVPTSNKHGRVASGHTLQVHEHATVLFVLLYLLPKALLYLSSYLYCI